jgi:hypothetical protein
MSGVGSTVSIAARFNGPQRSGNGGYAAGALAAFVGEPAEVSLRSPVPLDTELQVVDREDGSAWMLAGETLVCEGRPVDELARMTAEVVAPVAAGAEHVVIGWPIEIDGRKQHAGSALFSAGGELLAAARALMIEPRQG